MYVCILVNVCMHICMYGPLYAWTSETYEIFEDDQRFISVCTYSSIHNLNLFSLSGDKLPFMP